MTKNINRYRTSDSCDCKQVTKKSPPVRHIVRHNKICLEIKFRWNQTKLKFWQFWRPFTRKPEVVENFRFQNRVQRTRFTQKTRFQADPMKKVFSSFFSTAAILEMAAILKNPKTKNKLSKHPIITSPSFMFVDWAVFPESSGQVHRREKKKN